MSNRLHALHALGQSIWLDYIDRTILTNGDLARRIREDALMGMTSNPTIFEKALAEGPAYDEQLAALSSDTSDRDAFEQVSTTDVRNACDLFRSVYDSTNGADGFVSLEVAPELALDTDGTVAEARKLWALVDRPNLMIKVPGTKAGAPAVRRLTADGINVNITLLFSIDAHASVIEAFLSGLEDRVAVGKPIAKISSVASFFVSRVDSAVDKQLDAKAAAETDEAKREALHALCGKAAIANAKMAYRLFTEQFSGRRWDALASKGALKQRPLWASTSTKNPQYRDVMYVEQLAGPDTVNTLPPATIEAFRDHGEAHVEVDVGLDEAERVLAQLEAHGISLQDVTAKLLSDGLTSFEHSMVTLQQGIQRKRAALRDDSTASGGKSGDS